MTSRLSRVLILLVGFCIALSVPVSADAETVNLNLDDVEYSQIFQILGRLHDLNVLVDPSVTGRGSFELEGVPLKEALDLVAGFGGYDYQILGNTLVVATPEKLRLIHGLDVETVRFYQIEHAEPGEVQEALRLVIPPEDMYVQPDSGLVILLGAKDVLDRAEEIIAAVDKPSAKPVVPVIAEGAGLAAPEPQTPALPGYQVRVYRLNYAEPDTALAALSMMVDESRMRLDAESKSVIIRATEDEFEDVEAFLAAFDKPIPQVILEVWVQEMSTDAMRTLGIDWESPVSFVGGTSVPKFYELAYEPWNLFLALRALEDEGKAKLLANPKISTLSGKEASIFVGDKVPIVLTDGEGNATSIEFLESGINLRVTPRVSADGNITIQVRPEVSTFIWQTDTQYPQIRTREAETVVRVQSGQPVVIGGLLQEEENDLLVQIPIISQLPLLGQLFQWREKQTQQTEMTIFLVPRLVGEGEEAPEEGFFTSAR